MSLTKVSYSMITGAEVNVLDYGAKGDGITDDTSAIQAAIDDAVNNTLYFPAGTYYYTSLLTISNPMTITGDGYGSQLKPNTPSGNNIRINASNVLVEKIRMEGTSPGGFAVGYSGAVTNVTFQNCFFKDIDQVIWIWTANDVTVQNCVFDTTGYGVIQQINYVSSFVLVDSNIAKNMKADFVEANCAAAAPSESWTISNNIYEGAKDFPLSATEQRFVGITSVKNVTITGNHVQKSNGDAPFHLEDIAGNTIIANNIIDNCLCSGGNDGYIYLLNSAESVVIEGNIFFPPQAGLPKAYVIGTSSGAYINDIQFIGNRVVGNGATGNFGGLSYMFQTGLLNCVGNIFEYLTEGITFTAGNNAIVANNHFYFCNKGIALALSNSSGGGQKWLVVNNVFLETVSNDDIFTSQNTNGTSAPQNWTITGNVFNKIVTVTGQGGGTGTDAANDIAITNNIFQNLGTLTVSGAMPRRVLFGNIFQNPANNVTATAPDLPNYANDAAAAAGLIPVGGMYRNGSVVQVRVV